MTGLNILTGCGCSPGGHHFDRIGAGFDLLPGRLAKLVGAIGLKGGKVAMTAGHGDNAAGSAHAGSDNMTRLNGPAQRHFDIVVPANVPDGRCARGQDITHRGHSFKHKLIPVPINQIKNTFPAVKANVNVSINEARNNGPARNILLPGLARFCRQICESSYPYQATISHVEGRLRNRISTGTINQGATREQKFHAIS